MTDIVTRLRALADEMDFGWRPPLLREAADALEETANSRSLHEQCAKELGLDKIDLLRERDALKAKLAMGMQSIDSAWKVSYEKAEAEAAALRDIAQDLCDFNAKYLDEMRSKETWAVEGTLEESPFVTRFRHALSQPGPGAAYQERLRETESKFATQSHNLNVMNERLKKLEAVAVAVKANAALFSDDEPLTFENCEPIRLALAALGEKA